MELTMYEIKQLLEAFYNGTATEQEEETLRQVMTSTDCPAELEQERKLFLSLSQLAATTPSIPEGLEERISTAIDQRAHSSHPTRFRHRMWLWTSGIAASLIIGIGILRLNSSEWNAPTPQDTFSDPHEAYAVLKSTLLEVYAHLNEGMAQATAFEQELHQTNQEIHQLITANN